MAEENVLRIKKTPVAFKVIRTISFVFLALTSLFITGILFYYLLRSVGSGKAAEWANKISDNKAFVTLFTKKIVYSVVIAQLFFMLLLIISGRQGVAFKVVMSIFYFVFAAIFIFIFLPAFITNASDPLDLLVIFPEGQLTLTDKLIKKLPDNPKLSLSFLLPAIGYGSVFTFGMLSAIYFGTKKPKTGSAVLTMISIIFMSLIALLFTGIYIVALFKADWNLLQKPNVSKYLGYGLIGVPMLSQLLFAVAGLIGLIECKKN